MGRYGCCFRDRGERTGEERRGKTVEMEDGVHREILMLHVEVERITLRSFFFLTYFYTVVIKSM